MKLHRLNSQGIRQLSRFSRDRRGATSIEYGLIVGLIGTVLIVTVGAIGEQLRDDVFGQISSTLDSVLGEEGEDNGTENVSENAGGS